jgi:hypothetical protein
MTDQLPAIIDRAEIATNSPPTHAVPALAAAHPERAAAFLHHLQPKAETAAEYDANDYMGAA